jgi:anti-anti-sigma factor
MARESLRLEAGEDAAGTVASLVADFCARHAVPYDAANAVGLSVDEIVSNIFLHAYRGGPGPMDIALTHDGGELTVVVEDEGPPFDPTRYVPPGLRVPLARRPQGKIGLLFVKHMMDKIVYERSGATNRLRMVKRLKSSHAWSEGVGAKMRIAETRNGDVVVVEPQGRIDSSNARLFTEHLTGLISAGSRRVLVDLRQVIYVSSAGFRSLLIAGKSLEEAQGKLVLCGLSAEIRRLFEISAFDELFVICATQEEGVAKAM